MTAVPVRSSPRVTSAAILLVVLLLGGFVLARELDRGWFPRRRSLGPVSRARAAWEASPGLRRDLHGLVELRQRHRISVRRHPRTRSAFRSSCLRSHGSPRCTASRAPFHPPIGAGLLPRLFHVLGAELPGRRAVVVHTLLRDIPARSPSCAGTRRATAGSCWLPAQLAAWPFCSSFWRSHAGRRARAGGGKHDARARPSDEPRFGTCTDDQPCPAGTVLVLAGIVAGAGGNALFRFVVPFSLVASAAIVREWNSAAGSERLRSPLPSDLSDRRRYSSRLFLLALRGCRWGTQLLLGTFVTPFIDSRAHRCNRRHPTLLWSLPVVWTLWPRRVSGSTRLTTSIAIFWFGVVIASSGVSHRYYQAGLLAAWSIPVLVALAVALMSLASRTGHQNLQHRETALTIGIVAMCSLLVEFPFAAPIYTLYALPMAMLALACIVRAWGRTPVRSQMIVALFFLVFAYVRLIPARSGPWHAFSPIRKRPPSRSLELACGCCLKTPSCMIR